MTVVVFEDDGWGRLSPLTLVRHTSLLVWGTKTILDALRSSLPKEDFLLWGREEMQSVSKEKTKLDYNSPCRGETLFVNARVKPDAVLRQLLSRKDRFVVRSKGSVVAARTSADGLAPGVLSASTWRKAKSGRGLEGQSGQLFEGYWEIVETNGLGIAEQAGGVAATRPQGGFASKGPQGNIRISGSAEVEEHTFLDARLGPIVLDEGASVESFSRLSGPCYVGRDARVRSALVRSGTSIFDSCRVGGEVENSILMQFSNKAHGGFVGDSIVGEWVNLGAGSNFSNLKNTYGSVRVTEGKDRVETNQVKLGPVIGDLAKVSIGSLVYAGRCIGVGSHVSGLVKEDVPSFTFSDGSDSRGVELRLESVLETQRRMMERRGKSLGKAEEALIRRVYETTAAQRRKARVRKGEIG
ncbi:MAG TPA: putative sugar nucleotidyl transferase [Nitrososphaerales archaeon]|nr:putative sugar nucleotidyl transferase [Nitrososphaerales archaeon]